MKVIHKMNAKYQLAANMAMLELEGTSGNLEEICLKVILSYKADS